MSASHVVVTRVEEPSVLLSSFLGVTGLVVTSDSFLAGGSSVVRAAVDYF